MSDTVRFMCTGTSYRGCTVSSSNCRWFRNLQHNHRFTVAELTAYSGILLPWNVESRTTGDWWGC